MTGLTQRQADTLEAIKAAIARDGRPPTYREIATAIHCRGVQAAKDHVDALVRKGFVERDAGVARGLRVVAGAGDGSSA